MLLFRSEEHIDAWLGTRDLPRGGTMTPEQCWQLAQAWYADRLDPNFKRRTKDEAQAVFTKIGLAEEFWQL